MIFYNNIYKSPMGRLYRIYLHRLENEPRGGKAALTWQDTIEEEKPRIDQGYHKNGRRIYYFEKDYPKRKGIYWFNLPHDVMKDFNEKIKDYPRMKHRIIENLIIEFNHNGKVEFDKKPARTWKFWEKQNSTWPISINRNRSNTWHK